MDKIFTSILNEHKNDLLEILWHFGLRSGRCLKDICNGHLSNLKCFIYLFIFVQEKETVLCLY